MGVCAPDWRGLMRLTRDVAQQLANEGRIEIMQKGTVVSDRHMNYKGPIRLRLRTATRAQ